MNWLQKIAAGFSTEYTVDDTQNLPETYLDLGHNEWGGELAENTVAWYYNDLGLKEINTGHRYIPDQDLRTFMAGGRIDFDRGTGTVSFADTNYEATFGKDPNIIKKIIEELINKYPGIRFAVTTIGQGTIGLQQYWNDMFGD